MPDAISQIFNSIFIIVALLWAFGAMTSRLFGHSNSMWLLNLAFAPVRNCLGAMTQKVFGFLLVVIGVVYLYNQIFGSKIPNMPDTPYSPPDRVILIYGTWNNTNFEPLKETLKSIGIDKPKEIIVSNMGEAQLSATDIAQREIQNLQLDPSFSKSTVVDIVAHSFGGLVARRLAKLNEINPTIKIRNIITCGTPLGGINGVSLLTQADKVTQAYCSLGVVPLEMAWEYIGEHFSDYDNIRGCNYFLLGGTKVGQSWMDKIGSYEPYPKDGVVSIRSIQGTPPSSNLNKPSEDRRMRFLPYNHAELVSAEVPIRDYIVPVITHGQFAVPLK